MRWYRNHLVLIKASWICLKFVLDLSNIDLLDIDFPDTNLQNKCRFPPSQHFVCLLESWRCFQVTFWRHLQDMSWRHLQDIFSKKFFVFQDILGTSWRHFENVSDCYAKDVFKLPARYALSLRSLQDVLETSKCLLGYTKQVKF